MTPPIALTVSADVYERVRAHVFPGDGLEAAAILLCAKAVGQRTRLLARDAVLVPHAACARRERDFLTWPGASIEDAIDRAEADDLAIVLLHSHPGGLLAFSSADDASDRVTLPGLFAALGDLHGTAIMTPDGAIRARIYTPGNAARYVDQIAVPGQDIRYWWHDGQFLKRPLAFTSEMTQELGRLSACVIGVSGTGSIVAEQAARLGFGKVILIDHDKLEPRNLNRILNSTLAGAASSSSKVQAFAEAIEGYRGLGVAVPVSRAIGTREAVLAASESDVLFSCVDTHEARYFADCIAASFLIPLVDVGVSIPTRSAGRLRAIADVLGRVDYVRPGGPTLQDRDVYSPESLRAEYLRSVAPADHRDEVRAGYIKGIADEAPAVISLNMRAGSFAMTEFLARAYAVRTDGNREFARTRFSIAEGEEEHVGEDCFTWSASTLLGRGTKEPLLNVPSLKLPRKRRAA